MKAWRAIVALMLVSAGCMPLVVPINYRSIQGTVGSPVSGPYTPPCSSAGIASPASMQGGGLPPGVDLQPDGKIGGTPRTAGRWHAMVRLPRYQCEGRVYPDWDTTLHFEILELASSPNP